MSAREDGGPAFPNVGSHGNIIQPGMSLRDYFAIHAPEPSENDIMAQLTFDMHRNPHNDYHKPNRRSRKEIIADLRFEYADAMIAARSRDAS